MRHLDDGALRRLHDDPFAASNGERDHVARCDRCQHHASSVRADAELATRLFSHTTASGPGAEQALVRLRQHLREGGSRPAARRLAVPGHPRRRWASLAIVATPVVLFGSLVSANAAGWLTIFAPTQVAPLVVSLSGLSGLPALSAYGTMHVSDPSLAPVADAAHAAARSGLRVLQPASLPANVPANVRWEVVGHGSASFTLDAASARTAARNAGGSPPSIPSGLDGTRLTVDGGPAVVAVYGNASPDAAGSAVGLPTLVIAQGVRPTATTNGASLQQLKDFLLAQPGVSPQLAAAIGAIGDPASTLPVPIISGMTSQSITVDGVPAVVTGDSTGLGAAVIWVRDGIVYAVGGTLASSEVVDIARSLR